MTRHKTGPNKRPMVSKLVPPGLRDVLVAITTLETLRATSFLDPEKTAMELARLPDMSTRTAIRALRWMEEWAEYVESDEYRLESVKRSEVATRNKQKKGEAQP